MNPVLENKIRELLQFAQKHNLMEIGWQEGDLKVAFRRGAIPTIAPVVGETNGQKPQEPELLFVRSPIVGRFRRSVSKDRPPMIMIGNHIKPGDKLGIIDCMKIPTDVVSFCKGEIREIMVEEGQAVEYGQPLFSVLPHEGVAANGAS